MAGGDYVTSCPETVTQHAAQIPEQETFVCGVGLGRPLCITGVYIVMAEEVVWSLGVGGR